MAGVLQRPEELVHVPLRFVRNPNAKLTGRIKMKNAEGAGADAAVVLEGGGVCKVVRVS